MKKTAYLVIAAVLLCAAPSFAQGPFMDVPTDHWAYDAVNMLQKDGIVIGYPDGTFGGKRAMSRYEFAVAIARLLPMIPSSVTRSDTPTGFVTNEALQKALGDYAKKSDIPDISKFATKADVDAIRKLVDEFRDEIAALGVDVDALKRDVAALAARVDAIEAEMKRVRFTGDVNVFAITTIDRKWDAVYGESGYNGTMADLDERELFDTAMGRNIAVVRDFDLNIVGRVSDTVTANATINYGNYLNYLGGVDDYTGGYRPTSAEDGLSDTFFPYYLYIDAAMGSNTRVTVGRFPLQFTPYTLKKIDVDSYTNILKTDDGNYPVDGAMLGWKMGGVDLTLFAAKHDSNDYLWNGLTGQPDAGVYRVLGAMHELGGNALGGLYNPITQSAGMRAVFGGPWGGSIGATYYQAWSKDASWSMEEVPFDQARVWGADISVPLGSRLGFAGSWTRSDTLVQDGYSGDDIDDDNTAWDAKLTAGFGNVGLGVGYKRIESNFAAAGSWDKIGRWTNPTNVKGPYAEVSWPMGSSLSLNLNGEYLQVIDTQMDNDEDAGDIDIIKAEGGLKWAFSKKNSLDLNYHWVKYKPDLYDDARESYLTIGWAHQMSPNAGFNIGYQFINWKGDADQLLYGPDYRARVAVVQFGVTF